MVPSAIRHKLSNSLNPKIRTLALTYALLVVFASVSPEKSFANEEEVLLSFQYPAIGQVYINMLYDTRSGKGFLPLTELFSLLKIHYMSDTSSYVIRGNFPSPDRQYSINIKDQLIYADNEVYHLSPDEFRIGLADFFLAPDLFGEIFGLQIAIDMMNLEIHLSTACKLPVEERLARERTRKIPGSQTETPIEHIFRYPLKRSLLDGAMADYSITGRYGNGSRSLNYFLAGGGEVLGGDLQGFLSGYHSQNGMHSVKTGQLRWKYTFPQNKYITGITVGKISSGGIEPVNLKGIALTNTPVEPRISFGQYSIQGNAPPGSEVELYVNDLFSGFLNADSKGDYHFDIPVNYGTTRTRVLVFSPSGETISDHGLIQVPYNFLPPGVFTYHIEAGQFHTHNHEVKSYPLGGHARGSLGINNWLTAFSGIQYYQKPGNIRSFVPYYGLSARFAGQYTFNMHTSPGIYLDLSGQALYYNHVNINFRYAGYYKKDVFHLFHPDKEATAHLTIPLKIKGNSLLLRMGAETRLILQSRHNRLTADLSVRLRKVNLRINFRNNMTSMGSFNNWNEKLILPSFTYTLPHSGILPRAAKGLFIRGQVKLDAGCLNVRSNEIYLSKNFSRKGRFNLTLSREYGLRSTFAQAGIILDLDMVRNHFALQIADRGTDASHTLSGSAGWDRQNRKVVWDNRQQAGQSAASVVLFADNNFSGDYDEGDQLIPCNAITVDRPVSMKMGRDSVLRLHQLQSYHLYCLAVNRDQLPDPSLVPAKSQVSFMAEPNQFKKIEIPLYPGAILEGRVSIRHEDNLTGLGGIRLILRSEETGFEKTIRSFADGEFYCMDLVPGTYKVEVDPVQLKLLNMRQSGPKDIEIKPLYTGGFTGSFEVNLVPASNTATEVDE